VDQASVRSFEVSAAHSLLHFQSASWIIKQTQVIAEAKWTRMPEDPQAHEKLG